VQRLGDQRKQYDDLIAHSPGCFRVAGTILEDEQNNQQEGVAGSSQSADPKAEASSQNPAMRYEIR
jgi:hypothetical protein